MVQSASSVWLPPWSRPSKWWHQHIIPSLATLFTHGGKGRERKRWAKQLERDGIENAHFHFAFPPACIIQFVLFVDFFAHLLCLFHFTFHICFSFDYSLTFSLHCPVIGDCHLLIHFDIHSYCSNLTAQEINSTLIFSLTFTLPFWEIPMPPKIHLCFNFAT